MISPKLNNNSHYYNDNNNANNNNNNNNNYSNYYDDNSNNYNYITFSKSFSWWLFVNPLTPKILLVILLTICHTILMMSIWRIWYWIN